MMTPQRVAAPDPGPTGPVWANGRGGRSRSASRFWPEFTAPLSFAFTLIELLVVVGVIAVLAALLLSAFTGVKARALRVACTNLQKQWAFGFYMYAFDNEGWLPREGYHTNGSVSLNNWAMVYKPQSKDVWYNAVASCVNVRPASSYATAERQASFYERNSFFHCPSARIPQEAFYGQLAFFSMAMNSQLIELPEDLPTIKLERIARPAQTVLLLDNLLDGETPIVPQQANNNLGQPAANANRFAGRRHGRSGVMAFADGHVQPVRGDKVVQTSGVNAGSGVVPSMDIVWEP